MLRQKQWLNILANLVTKMNKNISKLLKSSGKDLEAKTNKLLNEKVRVTRNLS